MTLEILYRAEEINGKSIFRPESFRSLVDHCDYARNPETNLLDDGIGDTKV